MRSFAICTRGVDTSRPSLNTEKRREAETQGKARQGKAMVAATHETPRPSYTGKKDDWAKEEARV